MEILLDSRQITDRSVLHDLLTEKFAFPAYYGRNLDALYDLLSTWPNPVLITVSYATLLPENLGRYANAFLKTLQDAAQYNQNISLIISSEKTENNS